MLIASQKDMDWSKIDTVGVFSWGSGVEPAQDRKMIGCAPVATVPKNPPSARRRAQAFANPEWERFNYPVPPITVGSLTKMVVMRKKIADGTATPQEIADFEQHLHRAAGSARQGSDPGRRGDRRTARRS